MKPLPALPLTSEDWSIWTERPQREPDMGAAMHACCRADRRDADLMLWARESGQLKIQREGGFFLVWRFGSGVVGSGLSERSETRFG